MFEDCKYCKHHYKSISAFPCNSCKQSVGVIGNNDFYTPTTPPVNPPKIPDEINHPTRYAGGKYECIDVMTDVFGVDAVKNFCKLNAFKYLWREQNKNGVEDLKKASWYLDKLIELSEGVKNG